MGWEGLERTNCGYKGLVVLAWIAKEMVTNNMLLSHKVNAWSHNQERLFFLIITVRPSWEIVRVSPVQWKIAFSMHTFEGKETPPTFLSVLPRSWVLGPKSLKQPPQPASTVPCVSLQGTQRKWDNGKSGAILSHVRIPSQLAGACSCTEGRQPRSSSPGWERAL